MIMEVIIWNVQKSENRWVHLRVSNAGLRTIDKKGIDAVVAELRARGERVV